jgi:hypothetical protein
MRSKVLEIFKGWGFDQIRSGRAAKTVCGGVFVYDAIEKIETDEAVLYFYYMTLKEPVRRLQIYELVSFEHLRTLPPESLERYMSAICFNMVKKVLKQVLFDDFANDKNLFG